MRWKMLLVLVLAVAAVTAGAAAAESEAPLVRIALLQAESARYDGRPVIIRGEAVGDLMLRGEHGWLNISDGSAVLGVFAPAAGLAQVRFLGRHGVTGDLLEVRGVFRADCPVHHGGMHLDARQLKIIERGRFLDEPVRPARLALAVSFAFLALAAFLFRCSARRAGAGRRASP